MYKLTAGRTITNSNDKELFRITRLDGVCPVEADAIAHAIVELLNDSDFDIEQAYKIYMGK